MKLDPKNGIDNLIFGMKTTDVIALYGEPDKEYSDEENNKIFLYNKEKLRLTFYEDENFKLGYLICSNENLVFLNLKVIHANVTDFKNELISKGIVKWENEDFDLTENHFNESNWFTLQVEFGTIIRIEIGAVFNENDEMQFKFKNNKSIK